MLHPEFWRISASYIMFLSLSLYWKYPQSEHSIISLETDFYIVLFI